MNPKRASFPSIGGNSLLTIFAVLCLIIFALLSLSTAQASARLSARSAEADAAYYEADCKAQEILAQIRSGSLPDGVSREGNIYSYSCKISDTQTLEVSVRLTDVNEYTILRWQSVSTAHWEADENLDLWEGN